MTNPCCLTCEHCEAIDMDDDLILCCLVQGVEKAVPVSQNHFCNSYAESETADFILSSVLDDIDDEAAEPPVRRNPVSLLLNQL